MIRQLPHRGLEVVAAPAPEPVRRQAARIPPRHTGWLLLVGLAALLAFGRARFSLSLVQGDSMLPGLRSGDLLIVDRWAYRTADLQRGDLVVARCGIELLVKRVVGLPGEELELRLGELYVNRRAHAEYYPVEPGRLSLRRGRLFEDRYALLGDNRDVNIPASVHAVVSKHQIVGKVVHSLRLWPRGQNSHASSTAYSLEGLHPGWDATARLRSKTTASASVEHVIADGREPPGLPPTRNPTRTSRIS